MSRLLYLCVTLALVSSCASRAPEIKQAEDGFSDVAYMEEYSHIPWEEIGRSVEGRPIYKVEYGTGDDVTLFFSCFHGSERSTPRFGLEFANLLHQNPELVEDGKRVVIIPILNPDGFVHGTRNNARDVDLNRNYPTRDWGKQLGRRKVDFGETPASEPETRLVLKLLSEIQPDKILSAHQPRECNNPDGPTGNGLARVLAKYNGYPIEPYIGYPTPGSFGTYAGKELEIPMVTLELPRGGPDTPAFGKMWAENKDGLVAFVNCNLDELDNSDFEIFSEQTQ